MAETFNNELNEQLASRLFRFKWSMVGLCAVVLLAVVFLV